MDAFAHDADARTLLEGFAHWTGDSMPAGASVEIVAALFHSLLTECRPERFALCSETIRGEAAVAARDLQRTYERYLRGRLGGVALEPIDVEAALSLARMMMSQRRLTEAAQIYSQLAHALRKGGDDLVIGALSGAT